jgi:hypothetical protein
MAVWDRIRQAAGSTATGAGELVAAARAQLDRMLARPSAMSETERERAFELTTLLDSREVLEAAAVAPALTPELQAAALATARHLQRKYPEALGADSLTALAATYAQQAASGALAIAADGTLAPPAVVAAERARAAAPAKGETSTSTSTSSSEAVIAASNAMLASRDPLAAARGRVAQSLYGRPDPALAALSPLMNRASKAAQRADSAVSALRRARQQLGEAGREAMDSAAAIAEEAERQEASLPALRRAEEEAYRAAQAAHEAASSDFRKVGAASLALDAYALATLKRENGEAVAAKVNDQARKARECAQRAIAATEEALADSLAAAEAEQQAEAERNERRAHEQQRRDAHLVSMGSHPEADDDDLEVVQ